MHNKNGSACKETDIPADAIPLGRSELKAVLRSGMRLLSLPSSLEPLYREAHHRFATSVVKASLPVAVAAIAFVVLLTIVQFSPLPPFLWVIGAVILLAFALIILGVHVPLFNRWLPHCLGLGGMLCIMAMHVAVGEIGIPALSTAAQFGVAYITIAVFNMSNLPVRTATAWVFASLALVVVLAKTSVLEVNFSLFIYYAVSSAIIGVAQGLVQELRERRLFVQERLLALENLELDALTRELDEMARRDPLTGLYNRRYFNELLQDEWNRGRRNNEPLGLLYLDVDHFKRFNDFYGHQEGDRCLVMVAQALSRMVLRSGDAVARYGGEEFVALFPQTSLASAAQIAERIIAEVDALALPHASSPTSHMISVSIGVAALVPDHLHGPDILLQQADEALYQAKEAGRHCYRLAPGGS